MIKRLEKLPDGVNKGLDKLVRKIRNSMGDKQLKLLTKLRSKVEDHKREGYNVKRYERFCRQIRNERSDMDKYIAMLKDHGLIKR